jgi:hypothetical protein
LTGVYWCGWLERQLDQSKRNTVERARSATAPEMAMFEQIRASIEEVKGT